MRSLVILAPLIFFSAQNLKVDVDLVLVNATVADSNDRYVVGLAQKDFHVWEDKIEQKVEYLSTEDAPISVGIILDASGSMQPCCLTLAKQP